MQAGYNGPGDKVRVGDTDITPALHRTGINSLQFVAELGWWQGVHWGTGSARSTACAFVSRGTGAGETAGLGQAEGRGWPMREPLLGDAAYSPTLTTVLLRSCVVHSRGCGGCQREPHAFPLLLDACAM